MKNILVMLVLLMIITVHGFLFQRLQLTDPPIHPDETFFADTARQQISSGVPKTFLFEDQGLGQQHIRNYMYPPLYIDIVSLWFQLTSVSVEQLRLLSFVLSVITLVCCFLLYYKISNSVLFTTLTTGLLLTYGPFGIASRVGRMEILALFFFTFVNLLLYYLKPSKRRNVLLGSCAGLLLITHPMGIVLAIILTLILLFQEKNTSRIQLWHYLLPIIGFLLFWLIRYSDRLDLLVQQLLIQLQFKTQRIPIIDQLFETQVYWRSFFLVYLGSIAFSFILGVLQKKKMYIVQGVMLTVLLVAVWRGIEQWYLVYLLPMLLIAFSTVFIHSGRVLKFVVYGVTFSLFVAQGYSLIIFLQQPIHPYYQLIESLQSYLQKDQKVLVSHFPDPTLGLWSQGYHRVYQLEHVTGQRNLQEYLQTYDAIVVNYITNTELKRFINEYEFVKGETIKTNGYTSTILYLR